MKPLKHGHYHCLASLWRLIYYSEVFSWEFKEPRDQYFHDLHPGILNSTRELNTYPNFVNQLFTICEPNKANGVFQTFNNLLENAYGLLGDYWETINDQELSKANRQKASRKKIEQLERHPDIDKFYQEFSSCIFVENYILKLLNN